jgi:act minimal PKS chain-length factor (CLF/KS beta)
VATPPAAASTETARAVITGLAVAAPNGLTVEDYWAASLAGRGGIRALTGFDTSRYSSRLAGQIVDFVDAEHLSSRQLAQTDRVTRFALYATRAAFADAGVDAEEAAGFASGATLSNACGGFEFSHRELDKLWSSGGDSVSAYLSFAWFYACNTGQVSIQRGLRGPSAALVAEQAGGLDAFGYARRRLREGTRLMVTGGMESAFDPWGWVSHLSTGRVSRSGSPESAYAPFSAGAAGYVPGEGGAILITESSTAAAERGAPHRYGEIAGYAATFDPRPGSGRPPGLRRAAELALADAGLATADVDVVFADGAGSPDLDGAEAAAITGLFGPHGVPVCVPKALVGRLYAGGAPLDVVAALLSMRDGLLPPALLPPSDAYRLDVVVGAPREASVRTALVLARGRGGFNAALVLTAAE